MNWYLKVIKNYANFNGRARRKEYWMFFLINTIISFVLSFAEGLLFGVNADGSAGIISNIYTLALLVPSLAVAVRRIHDTGKSGWFILVPIYNFILAVTEGDKGPNKFGDDPKNEANTSDDSLDSHLMES